MPVKMSLIGKRFARLTVIGEADPYYSSGRAFRRSLCVCDCGQKCVVNSSALKRGKTKSCGCFRKENTAKMRTTHGHSTGGKMSRTYKTWCSIIERCTNPNADNFKHYGGRGVIVCDRWLKFEPFLSDVGERPDGKTIERIDNSKGYEPGNTRWATQLEQSHNKRNNRMFTFGGITACFSEMCRHFDVPESRTRKRLELGWGIGDAFLKLGCKRSPTK